ncbi:unnamed protein product [Timema podura]|uniref:Uncharacterized protein n=1 Tax=Timema podura TaxID=61482 RepID=A0ABN7P2U3_TIMPD|nr:unnamed protein product [Timema podura]
MRSIDKTANFYYEQIVVVKSLVDMFATGAYHGMIQAAALSSEETVLIHAGHTPIGQAAIAFALHIGSTVFTTIAEIVHKEFLMKRFPLKDQLEEKLQDCVKKDTQDRTLVVVSSSLSLIQLETQELTQGQEDLNNTLRGCFPSLSADQGSGQAGEVGGHQKLILVTLSTHDVIRGK